MPVVELVMKTKLTYLALIVEITNAILETKQNKLYFAMKGKNLGRKKRGVGNVIKRCVIFPWIF